MLPMVPYLETGGSDGSLNKTVGSNGSFLKTVGSKGSLLRNGGLQLLPSKVWGLQCFFHLETGGDNDFSLRN